jgi:hypothetical protein
VRHQGIFSPNHTPSVIERLYDRELFSDGCEEKFIRQDRLEELPDFPLCAGVDWTSSEGLLDATDMTEYRFTDAPLVLPSTGAL